MIGPIIIEESVGFFVLAGSTDRTNVCNTWVGLVSINVTP